MSLPQGSMDRYVTFGHFLGILTWGGFGLGPFLFGQIHDHCGNSLLKNSKMATEEEHVEVDDESAAAKGKKIAKYDSGAADLEKVTDYVEEAEISSQTIGEVCIKFKKYLTNINSI